MRMLDTRKKYLTWLAYAPVGFILIYYVLMNLSFINELSVDYLLFLLLAVGVAVFPVRTNDSVFTMISGVSLATFVSFGLLPELLLTSIALLHVLYQADIRWDQHYRYALNLLMTAIQSFVSAIAYYLTTEFLATLDLNHYRLIPLGAYLIVQILTNQLFRTLVFKYYYSQENVKFFNKFLIFALRTNLMILPISFILIYLYLEMGSLGILLGALPFMTITIGMKYFYKSRSNNMILTDLNKYSQRLTSKMEVDSVIDSFGKYLLKIFPAHRILYFNVVNPNNVTLERVYHRDKPMTYLSREITLKSDSVLAQVLETQVITTYSKAEEWNNFFAGDINFGAESAIALPVNILSQDKGIIVMTHNQRSVYDDFLISLVEVFYQYFLVVLENAYNFERLEISSNTDYLTNMPNLRGFSQKIKEVDKAKNFDSLSTIVLDLDYFKRINDEHGHEAGNDVLKQISDILKEFCNENLFVARYGGEEFIIFLRDYGKEGAYEVAEEIRKKIEETIYTPRYSIVAENKAEITVTASLGIATYPDDCDDIYDLISLADRVMYLKSKKDGRNRVAEFVKES